MSVSVKTKTVDETAKVAKAVEKAAYRNFGHGAASISKDVKSTLEKAEGPSEEGQPPHTHKGVFLRRAVRYAADKEGAVIGPRESVVGDVGAVHEFGEVRDDLIDTESKGVVLVIRDYPKRPFMFPGLERGAPRFAEEWRGSVGE